MPLHLAHHKSYHPYSKANIEKVRKDEEIQEELERIQSQNSLNADSHFRLQQLRKQRQELQSGSSKVDGKDRLKAAEQEVLHGKHRSLKKWDDRFQNNVGAADANRDKGKAREDDGHINFWKDLESDNQHSNRSGSSKASGKGAQISSMEEAKNKFKQAISAELHPWYQDEELKNGEEKKKTVEQRLEAAYKDSTIKSSNDPLKAMSTFLSQRQAALNLQSSSTSSSRNYPYSIPNHTSTSRGSSRWDRPSSSNSNPNPNEDSSSNQSLRESTKAREESERLRAEALMNSRRRFTSSSSSIASTPFDNNDYSDQFYREDVRAAKRNRWEREEEERRTDLERRRRDQREEESGGNRDKDRDGKGASFNDEESFDLIEDDDDDYNENHLCLDNDYRSNFRSHSNPPSSSQFFSSSNSNQLNRISLPRHELNHFPRRASFSTIDLNSFDFDQIQSQKEGGDQVIKMIMREETRRERRNLEMERKEEENDEKDNEVLEVLVDAEASGSGSTNESSGSNPDESATTNNSKTDHSKVNSTNPNSKKRNSPGDHSDSSEDEKEEDDDSPNTSTSIQQPEFRESMYPVLLTKMIQTVLDGESFLFNSKEVHLLNEFLNLDYESKYLFSLLIQRKTKWFRINDIKESKDLNDVRKAVDDLCLVRGLDDDEEDVEMNQDQDEDDEDLIIDTSSLNDPDHNSLSSFTMREKVLYGEAKTILSLLKLNELKILGKEMGKVKGNTREELINNLLATKNQSTLFSSNKSNKTSSSSSSSQSPSKDGKRQMQLNFSPSTSNKQSSSASSSKKVVESSKSKANNGNNTQGFKIVESASQILGGLVGLRPSVRSLIDRVALVYYRGASLGSQALTVMVLSHCRKRNYPTYSVSRSTDLFRSRDHLVAFERALLIELKIDDFIEQDGSEEALRRGVKILDQVWKEWKDCIKECEDLEAEGIIKLDKTQYHKMRFHAGWILTRVVYKSAHCLGRFKLYKREVEVLESLLAQKVFRRGRRGAWYDRLALIYQNYNDLLDEKVNKDTSDLQRNKSKTRGKEKALEIAQKGLQDPDTHLIYHDGLQKRIQRLENQLSLPFGQKSDFSYCKLKECEESHFKGIRLDEMISIEETLESPTSLRDNPFFHKIQRSDSNSSSLGNHSRSESPNPNKGEEGSLTVRAPLRKRVKIETTGSSSRSDSRSMSRQPSNSNLNSAGVSSSETPPPPPIGEEEAIPIGISLGTTSYNHTVYQVQKTETRKSMHSVWRGADGQGCRVEDLVLQRYSDRGFRGFHDEGSVLLMLFTLLMWDVIYSPVEGAFETEYQREPLDMREDSFSIARAPLIQQRLRLIESEPLAFLTLIYNADQTHRPLKTFALACRWDDYSLRDLLEISQCLGGESLSFLCQMLSEEWGHCTSGMPDLILWKMKEKKKVAKDQEEEDGDDSLDSNQGQIKGKGKQLDDDKEDQDHQVTLEELERISKRKGRAKFCEVKGPGDALREKQKVWIDVLLRANVEVEVGYVKEEDEGKGKGKSKGKGKGK